MYGRSVLSGGSPVTSQKSTVMTFAVDLHSEQRTDNLLNPERAFQYLVANRC